MSASGDVHASFANALSKAAGPAPLALLADRFHQREARFAVYRNNVIAGLTDTLAQSFPVVERLVGADFFRALARSYITTHLPHSPVLTDYCRGLAEFIDGFPPAAGLPYLGDVARLEAGRIEAYHAADAPALDPSGQHAADAAGNRQLVVAPHPAARILHSRFPVLTIWELNQPGVPRQRLKATEAETVLITRPEMLVQCHRLTTAQADAFRRLPVSGTALHEIEESTREDIAALGRKGALTDPTARQAIRRNPPGDLGSGGDTS